MYNYIIKKLSINSLYLKKGINLVCIHILCVSVGTGHYYLRLNNQRLEIINKINLTNEMVIKPLKEDLSKILNEDNNKLYNNNKSTMMLSGIIYYVMSSNHDSDTASIGKIFDIPSIIIHKSPKSIFIKISDIETKIRKILPDYINFFLVDNTNIKKQEEALIASINLIDKQIKVLFTINDLYEKRFKSDLLSKSILYSFLFVLIITLISKAVDYYYKNKVFSTLNFRVKELEINLNNLQALYDKTVEELLSIKVAHELEKKIDYSIISRIISHKFVPDDYYNQHYLLVKRVILSEIAIPISSKIKLSDLKNDIMNYFKILLHTKKIRLSLCSNLEEILIPYRQEFFYQIIFSLIHNRIYACDYSSAGEMEVYLTQRYKGLEIKCLDNGMEISIYKIDEYAKTISMNVLHILPWSLIEDSLQQNKYEFIFKREHDKNISTLVLPYNVERGVNKDKKICYIKDYLK